MFYHPIKKQKTYIAFSVDVLRNFVLIMVSFSSCNIDDIPVLLVYTRFEDERSVVTLVSLCLYCNIYI